MGGDQQFQAQMPSVSVKLTFCKHRKPWEIQVLKEEPRLGACPDGEWLHAARMGHQPGGQAGGEAVLNSEWMKRACVVRAGQVQRGRQMPLPHSDKGFPKEDQVLFDSDSPQPSDFECTCQCFLYL